jgi:hypothetical protein
MELANFQMSPYRSFQGAGDPALQAGVERVHVAGSVPSPAAAGLLGQARGQHCQLPALPLRSR